MDRMEAVKIENVIVAEVLRWWKHAKESTKSKPWSLLHRLQQFFDLYHQHSTYIICYVSVANNVSAMLMI